MRNLWVWFVLSRLGNLIFPPFYRKWVFNAKLVELASEAQILVPAGLVVFVKMVQWSNEQKSTLAIANRGGDKLEVASVRDGMVLAQGDMQRFGADVYRNVRGRPQHSVMVRVFFHGQEGSEIVESLAADETGRLPHMFSHREIVDRVREVFKLTPRDIHAIGWPTPDNGWHFTDAAGRTMNVSWTKDE